MEVIDEIPHIFQRRDVCFSAWMRRNSARLMAGGALSGGDSSLTGTRLSPFDDQSPPSGAPSPSPDAPSAPLSTLTIRYTLRPTRRGVYGFGLIRAFASTRLGLVQRRYTCGEAKDVAVYPSYLMLNKYELLAVSNNLAELGIKKIRRAGNNTEFEQIKDYVAGDEYRAINWKASARSGALKVNIYRDERSQQIFNLIDKGRVMQQAFEQMTLLDYAINASLVLSYVAMHREDKAGLITFADQWGSFVPASKRPGHMQTLLESLYAQQTVFGETDFAGLCTNINKQVSKRSLLILYTNFSGMGELERQLPFLRLLNSRHRLLVVFFENAELKDYIASVAETTEDYYRHVIAEKFAYEKRLIVSTLKQNGIFSLLTTPKSLSIDVINKYLEMKSRQLLV
ncbi:MAG: DUF58 domain-containing protein [Prevotella sp.]|nr:DUF58 domain-containing protein [Prevotella sp.]